MGGIVTRQQRLIVEALRRADGWVTGKALLKEIGSSGSVKTVHVQVCLLRRELGGRIELQASNARDRGYRLIRCDA